MIIGLDFGTTNTGAATYDGRTVQLLPIDPKSQNPNVCRTAIYITRGQEFFLGNQAVDLYFHQNIGRPSRYRKIWVGEILQVFAELPPFYRDVYVFEDEFSPGRLFLSIKTVLRNANYLGTVFQEQWFSASDLAAIFLMGMKIRADQALGQPATEVVLGRPVFFSSKPEEDIIAQSRLVEAALKAGFEKVYFEYEPVAAALSYERSIRKPEVVLVFDFGGGTLDFTIMQVGNPSSRKVLATGGIPVAGDIFDQRLLRVTIPPHLGEGDYFIQDHKRYPVPAHIYDLLTNPQEILSLNTPQNLEMLRSIHQGSLHKNKTEALLKIVSSNYALLLFDVVERAKCRLSGVDSTLLSVITNDFIIQERISRQRFENAIRHEFEAIRAELLATIDRSGLKPNEIDRVIRTGGSSQIPLFAGMLDDLFGIEKVRSIDIFSSVTSGLGIRAHEISTGQSESTAGATPWTSASTPKTEALSGREAVKSREAVPVNLEPIRKRLSVSQDFETGSASLPAHVIVFLGERRLEIERFSPGNLRPETGLEINWSRQTFVSPIQRSILLATDSYKLVNRDLSAMFIARQSSQNGPYEQLHLEAAETVVAQTAWNPPDPEKRFLCLVTSTGQIRAFEARLMADHVRPRPYFQLEKRYTGLPFSLLFADASELVLVATNAGRIGLAFIEQAKVVVYESLRTRKDEKVICAGVFGPQDVILAVNQDGSALVLSPADIPVVTPPGSRGVILRRNFQTAVFVPLESVRLGESFVLTSLSREIRLTLPKSPIKPRTLIQVASLETGEIIIGSYGKEISNHV